MNCPHCGVDPKGARNWAGEDHVLHEGCTGVCVMCWEWWAFEGGQLVKYSPTVQQVFVLVMELIERQRTAMHRGNQN